MIAVERLEQFGDTLQAEDAAAGRWRRVAVDDLAAERQAAVCGINVEARDRARGLAGHVKRKVSIVEQHRPGPAQPCDTAGAVLQELNPVELAGRGVGGEARQGTGL